MSELSTVILAGGGGRRLGGTEKALLTLDDRTLLERLVAAVGPASSELVLVTSRPEPLRPALKRVGWRADPERPQVLRRRSESTDGGDARMRLVSERDPGGGPVAALEAGLAAVRSRLAWVVACDLAFPRPEMGRLLAAALPESPVPPPESPVPPPDGPAAAAPEAAIARAAIPRVGRRLQPLCAVYERPAAQTAAACLNDGLRRASDFLSRLAVFEVPEDRFRALGDPATLFLDIDTPEDLSRARRVLLEQQPNLDDARA